jgi:hypothetical protein
MTETPQLQLGSLRPDGTRGVTVRDDHGLLVYGDVGLHPAGRVRSELPLTLTHLARLVAMAGRAPSVHNTQPWRFRACGNEIELHADTGRMLRHIDPTGREMLISCGAALYGLRLGMRRMGYLPEMELLPDATNPSLLARLWPAGTAQVTRHESELLAALPHRHTHRGQFSPGDVPARLLAGMLKDAAYERAELIVMERPEQVDILSDLMLAAAADAAGRPEMASELRSWVHPAGMAGSDGIPACARVRWPGGNDDRVRVGGDEVGSGEQVAGLHRRLPQRNFGLPGTEAGGGYPPSVTAVLTTAADTPADWIRAGQALHRILLHAATRWVFASLYSEPLESPARRAELRARLNLAGEPQMLLQFGRSNTAPATARRPASQTLTAADLPGAESGP